MVDLGDVARGEPVERVAVRRMIRLDADRVEKPQGRAGVEPGAGAVERADHLDPHVLAAAVLARPGQQHERPVRELEHERAGVDVAVLLGEVDRPHRARGVHRLHLGGRDPADHVEVVDQLVAEHPSRAGDVLLAGRLVIV